ncbi:hypothetical protein ACRAWB_16475 [Leifsonia poae]|uniref:hypothetical protein n=1 Tax=Leifsonia poae TaxID=110933 RepID=UPI003D69FD5B
MSPAIRPIATPISTSSVRFGEIGVLGSVAAAITEDVTVALPSLSFGAMPAMAFPSEPVTAEAIRCACWGFGS